MTDNEIIKALECCNGFGNCPDDCPYHSKEFKKKLNCLDEKEGIIAKSLDLINRQKAELERLKDLIISNDEENLSYVATAIKEERESIQIEHVRILKAEIERLENKLFDANQGIEFYKANFMAKCDEINEIKSEAIKEFAERLKAMSFYGEESMVDEDRVVWAEDIDKVKKEMVGKQRKEDEGK